MTAGAPNLAAVMGRIGVRFGPKIASMALLCADTVVAESGIALTMESVTFFRNVAAMFGGALVVLNPWPLRGFVKDTSFIQGDALLLSADIYDWHPQGGPDAREGKANHVQLNTVYDGGYTTAGLMPYAHSSAELLMCGCSV